MPDHSQNESALPPRLADALAGIRVRGAAFEPFYDEIVVGLKNLRIGAAAPAAGDPFPDFALPDAHGHYQSLADLAADGPLVISFQRGTWCPYCQQEMAAWSAALPALAEAGGRLIVVTGETRGAARQMQERYSAPVTVLCDVDHGVALSLGLAFFAGEPLLDFYTSLGIDFHALYGSECGFLPVPATFALAADLTIIKAWVEVDFRSRAEPAEMIAAIASSAG